MIKDIERNENMNITIVGAGAIGGVIGAHLVKEGHNVTFLDINEAHVKTMRESGLTIDIQEQTFTVPVEAYTVDEFLLKNRKLGPVLLAVKGQFTKTAINSIKDLLGDDSYVVSFQNGLCEYDIAEIIGKERTVGCFVNLFADYMEPGLISYGGVGSLYIGELDGSESVRVNELITVLKSWGDARATDNILGYLWSKLAYGAVLTLTATTNLTIATFFESKKYRPLVIAISNEVLQIAHKNRTSPESFDDWCPSLMYPDYQKEKNATQFLKLAERLKGYTKVRSGIWRDIAVRKRKSEISYQYAPVITEGEKLGFKMDLLKKLVQMIEEIERGKRGFSEDNLFELEQLMDKTIKKRL